LDQNDRLKGKFLDLKTDAKEVLGLERSLYAVKRGLLAFEMGAKQPSRWFYTILRSRKGGGGEIYEEFMTNSEEHRRTRKS